MRNSRRQPPLEQDAEGYPPLLADLADQATTYLRSHNIAPRLASGIGVALAEHMRSRWGGLKIYIPKGQTIALEERDREIRAKFNGHNQRALASAYDLSLTRVYQILAGQRPRARRPG